MSARLQGFAKLRTSWGSALAAGELFPPDLVADADRLVIGLNPPFGKGGQLADKFILHSASFQPRLLILIVPPWTVVSPFAVLPESPRTLTSAHLCVPACDTG